MKKKTKICNPKILDFTLMYLQMYGHNNYRKIVSCEIRTNNFVNCIKRRYINKYLDL